MNPIFKLLLLLSALTLCLFAEQKPLQKVTLQLHWKHQFEFAGYYIAKEKGFYKELGLEVDISEYENGLNLAQMVAHDEHTFAVGYSSTILDEINTNDILLLSANFQSSPHVLVSLKSSGIKSIKEFKYKKVMIDTEAIKSAAFIAMFHANGLSFNDVIIQEPTFKVEHLIDKTTDLGSYYYSNETYILDKQGIAYDIWDPKDYGFDFYSDILFTSKKEAKAHPEIVENFRRASLKGWEYAFEHIDETVELILDKYNSQNKTQGALLYEARVLKNLAYQGHIPFGTIQKEKIQRLLDIYTLLGLHKNNVNVDTLIYEKSNSFFLTEQEKIYLAEKKVIKMCVDPNWMPFEKIENGAHVGMAADFFKVLRDTTKLNIELVPTNTWMESIELAKQRKCDILSLVMKTPERTKYLDFTEPYLKIPIVMATKTDVPFVDNFHSLAGKKLGLPQGYAFAELLRVSYPELHIVEVKDLEDGLDRVVRGEIYGYIGSLATIGYAFQKRYTGELKISGKFDGSWDMGIGVRNDNPALLSIFQKAVKSVDKDIQQKLLNSWLSIQYVKETDYTLVLQILAGFTIIISFLLFFYLKQSKLQKQLKLMATTDFMTKLYNRRYFEEACENYFQLSKRSGINLSFIMLDVDNFKYINDTYGHKIGDTILINLAQALQTHSRKTDIVCRYGGEEFIILLPNTNIHGAKSLADKIRAHIEECSLDINKETKVKFTVSVGVSQVDADKEKNFESAIKRADDALYEAKETGKNKVCLGEA